MANKYILKKTTLQMTHQAIYQECKICRKVMSVPDFNNDYMHPECANYLKQKKESKKLLEVNE